MVKLSKNAEYTPIEDDEETPSRNPDNEETPSRNPDNGEVFHLDMEELEEGGRFDSFSKVSLAWKDLHVSATLCPSLIDRCKKKSTLKEILNGVSGIVEPGQFMAIMGASGAGKTTLLNTLAFRNGPEVTTTGEITVNAKTVSQSQIKRISAYVQQNDNFVATLTVKEVMMFHANLRMDNKVVAADKEKKVEAVLVNFGLSDTKDVMVGSPEGPIRGISGGERKRLSVATEILMDPPLLFIDEPTSGLDSFMAENIIRLISQLAQANRTVLCTIHQPTSQIFAMFDRVCLVSEGEIAFMGDTSSILDHFNSAGFPCSANFNPADHYIFTIAIRPGDEENCKERCQRLIEHYKDSNNYINMMGRIETAEDEAPGVLIKDLSKKRIRSPLLKQVGENCKRSLKNIFRNPAYAKTRVIQSIIIGLLMGLTFLNTKDDQRVAQNKSGALFNLIVYFTFANIAIQTMSIPEELSIVKREYKNGMYSTLPYFFSKIVAEIPYLFGLSLITMGICYFMIGFKTDFLAFITCIVGIAGVSWCGTGLGWFLSSWTGDAKIAGAITAPIIMPLFLFGGLYQSEESTPVYFEPIKYISWFRYGFNMLMVNEFRGMTNITCPAVDQCSFHDGEDVLRYFAIQDDIWWPNILALFLIGGGFCFFAWTCLVCRLRR